MRLGDSRKAYFKALLHSLGVGDIGDARDTKPVVRDAVDLGVARPAHDLAKHVRRRNRQDLQKGLTLPVQNVGHAAFNAVPPPCASHAER